MEPLENCSYFLHYTDALFGKCIAAMNDLNVSKEKRTRIVHKLLDSPAFYSILPEVETFVCLYEQRLSPELEPQFPGVGPDFWVRRDKFTSFVEVCSLATDQSELDFNLVGHYVHQKLQKTPSKYLIVFDVSRKLQPYSPFLKRSCNAARHFLSVLEEAATRKGTLYISDDGEPIQFIGGDFVLEKADFLNAEKLRVHEQLQECPVRISYELADVEQPGNYSMTTGGGSWLGGCDRIRGVLLDKLRQLPKKQRNIIILDWSYSATGEHDFLDALYGTSQIAYGLGENNVEFYHEKDGFFAKTSRVQAVVALNRNISGELKPRWTVFPTNDVNADNRMTLEQLRLFGELASDLEGFAL